MAGDDSIRAAFLTVCIDAEPAKSNYVSLYRIESYYGGPEEGGWWGCDYTLVATLKCDSPEQAAAVQANVKKMAEQLSKDAKAGYLAGCAAECAWLESRGLESDYLPEVSGEDQYAVFIEEVRGEMASTGSRSYS